MARFNPPGFGGYEPRTTPPERRDFLDVRRLVGRKFEWRDAWVANTTYPYGSVVSFDDSTYVCINENGCKLSPPDTEWQGIGGGGGDIDDAFVGHTNIAGGVGVMWDHINVNVADQDVNGNHSSYLGRGTYRVPETGLYLVTGQAHAFVNNNPQRFIAGLGRMGASSGYGVNVNVGSDGATARILSQGGEVENSNEAAGKALASTVAWVGRLEEGDQIGLMTYNGGGNNIALALAGCVNQLCVTPIRGATGATGATGPQGPPGPPGPPGTGGGSDGFTFVQEATPTADTHGQTWYNTATGSSLVWYTDADSSQWVEFSSVGGLGDPPLLKVINGKSEVIDGFMDSQIDVNLSDAETYPYPTIAEITVSGIYIKPDRTAAVGCYLWTQNHLIPGSANGQALDFGFDNTSSGASWTPIGGLHGSISVEANEAANFVVRLIGVQGGATGYSRTMLYTIKRYKATS